MVLLNVRAGWMRGHSRQDLILVHPVLKVRRRMHSRQVMLPRFVERPIHNAEGRRAARRDVKSARKAIRKFVVTLYMSALMSLGFALVLLGFGLMFIPMLGIALVWAGAVTITMSNWHTTDRYETTDGHEMLSSGAFAYASIAMAQKPHPGPRYGNPQPAV